MQANSVTQPIQTQTIKDRSIDKQRLQAKKLYQEALSLASLGRAAQAKRAVRAAIYLQGDVEEYWQLYDFVRKSELMRSESAERSDLTQDEELNLEALLESVQDDGDEGMEDYV